MSDSIQAWGQVAADEAWRRADADRTRLYEQCGSAIFRHCSGWSAPPG
jgi:hypothetical protein